MKWGGSMKKVFMYALANIFKSKGQTISFLLMILLAMTTLTVGVVAYTDCEENFERECEHLNAGDGLFVIDSKMYSNKILDDISNNEKVTDTYLKDVQLCYSTCKFADGTEILRLILFKKTDKDSINKTEIVEEADKIDDNSVYLPLLFKTGGGYKLGDDFAINVGGKAYKYKVGGFFENIYLGSTNQPAVGVMMSDKYYNDILNNTESQYNAKMINFSLTNHNDSGEFAANIFSKYSKIDGKEYDFLRFYYNGCRVSITFMSQICSVFVVSFALVILVIALLLIRFRIINSIEDDMKSIGALKAMGYTSSNLIFSYLVQFLLITVGGIILGSIAAYFVLPFLASALEIQSGMVWSIHISHFVIGILALMLLSIVSITVSLTTQRIKHLSAISALRNGFSTHSFRKNYFPFLSTKGPASWIFALKNVIANKKQNFMICVIVSMLAFVSVFVYSLYYNMAVDNKAFVDAVAGEVPTVNVSLTDDGIQYNMAQELEKDDRVRKALYWTNQSVNYDGHNIYTYVCDDFSRLDTELCFEGRYPEHENEIALGGSGAGELGKKVGDEITFKLGEEERNYLITGLIQTGNNMGFDAEITTEGMKRLVPEWKGNNLYVYLEDGVDCDVYMEDVREKYTDRVKIVASIEELLEAQIGAYEMITRILAIVILIMSCFIITLILYLVLKTMINKNKRSFGIQKAMGYTTKQLILQTGYSITPTIVIGAFVGCSVGVIGSNPLSTLMLHSIGIMRLELKILPLHFAIIGAGFVVLSFAIAILISMRIRKISACTLIQE